MSDSFAEFVQHLTDNAKSSLQQADAIARTMGSAYIGTEHLLLGVLSQDTSVGSKLLSDAGITLDRARLALNLTPRSLVVSTGAKGLSETAKLTLKMSWDVAQEFQQDFCGTEHILYSILTQKNARATVLLRDMNIDTEELLAEVEDYLGRQSESDTMESVETKKARRGRSGALETFGTDLTEKARKDELDVVIGRDAQIERVITILARRTKNNPVLIGEPGVGKTAIVEGLATRIAKEEVPDYLLDCRVIQLDVASMIAGTKYRGEFEERLKKIMDELSDDPHAIVFIDELHLLVGAGAAEGALDAANMLKPALARGKMRLIGATTLDEYRKHIEKDSALERRFQTVTVPEPSVQDTLAILKGLRHHYETHHNVTLQDAVLEDAVHMADRYVTERFMPDKAIDVVDEAASRARVRQSQQTPTKEREYLRQQKHLNERMEDAVANEDYERAALYKTRLSQLNEKMQELKKENAAKQQIELTADDIAGAIAAMTGIPVQQVLKSEAKMLKNLEKHLSKHIIGQSEAISHVAKAIRRSRSGISHPKRPIGSFIFMGPTGVGKTELARVLAREVFGSEDALIKIDMSEFGEKHTSSRLVGAPAGYVGYEEGGQLTEKIRRRPYSVVLFDEIEKAHRDVFQLLLQLLEDGTLTDAKGRSVSFSNAIIILTSNLGADQMYKEAELGFNAKKQGQQLDAIHQQNSTAAHKELEKIMRPELINRFDNTMVFRALSRQEVGKIFQLQLKDLQERLLGKGLNIVVSPAAKRYLLNKGYTPRQGVRPLRRVLQDELEHGIAEGLIDGRFTKGDVIGVGVHKGKLSFESRAE